MKGVGTFDSRPRSLASPIYWLALAGLLCIAVPTAAQESDLGVFPLPVNALDLNLRPSTESHPQSQDPVANTAQQEKKPQPQVQQGTSNDRILWTLPNFLTLENAENIPPLTPAEKFKVTVRGIFDPFEFVLIGFVAGINQASNSNPTYGQGMQGYAKRYGTAYGDNAIENFMASAVLPSVLHQDPRYYQMGHGGFWRRSKHAVSRVLFTRSDSGEKQLNYSELGGAMIAASISTYTYHPQSERGFGDVASVWGSQMGWDVVTYMIKEFWPDLRNRSKKNRQARVAEQPATNSK